MGPWRKSLWGGLSGPLLLITGPGVPHDDPAFRCTLNEHFPLNRNTPLMCFSVKAGKMSVCVSKGQWRCYLWITCWPATSGHLTPFSLMAKNPLLTTWLRPTSFWDWRMMGHCYTPWGTSLSYNALSFHNMNCCLHGWIRLVMGSASIHLTFNSFMASSPLFCTAEPSAMWQMC